jgi:hypothetical protein
VEGAEGKEDIEGWRMMMRLQDLWVFCTEFHPSFDSVIFWVVSGDWTFSMPVFSSRSAEKWRSNLHK